MNADRRGRHRRGEPRPTPTLRGWSTRPPATDGYARSDDGGDTWVYPQTGLDHRYVWEVAVPESDPDTVVVSAADGARNAHDVGDAESYVYRTVDTTCVRR